MTKPMTYQGQLSVRDYGEASDLLFLSTEDNPFAEVLHDEISGKKVSVRYWISDKQCTKDEAQEDALRHIFGVAETEYGAHYSEYTGYLWTDEEVMVGGHDLLEELKSAAGKWLVLEIDIHE